MCCFLFPVNLIGLLFPYRNERFGDGAEVGIVGEGEGILRLEEVLVVRGVVAECDGAFRSCYIQEEQSFLR